MCGVKVVAESSDVEFKDDVEISTAENGASPDAVATCMRDTTLEGVDAGVSDKIEEDSQPFKMY